MLNNLTRVKTIFITCYISTYYIKICFTAYLQTFTLKSTFTFDLLLSTKQPQSRAGLRLFKSFVIRPITYSCHRRPG